MAAKVKPSSPSSISSPPCSILLRLKRGRQTTAGWVIGRLEASWAFYLWTFRQAVEVWASRRRTIIWAKSSPCPCRRQARMVNFGILWTISHMILQIKASDNITRWPRHPISSTTNNQALVLWPMARHPHTVTQPPLIDIDHCHNNQNIFFTLNVLDMAWYLRTPVVSFNVRVVWCSMDLAEFSQLWKSCDGIACKLCCCVTAQSCH